MPKELKASKKKACQHKSMRNVANYKTLLEETIKKIEDVKEKWLQEQIVKSEKEYKNSPTFHNLTVFSQSERNNKMVVNSISLQITMEAYHVIKDNVSSHTNE